MNHLDPLESLSVPIGSSHLNLPGVQNRAGLYRPCRAEWLFARLDLGSGSVGVVRNPPLQV